MAFQILYTSFLGLRLWVLLTIAAAFLLLIFLLLLLNRRRRRQQHPPPLRLGQRSGKPLKLHLQEPNPAVSMEISDPKRHPQLATILRIDIPPPPSVPVVISATSSPPPPPASTSGTTADGESPIAAATPPTIASNLGWGQWYSLRQLEAATGRLAEANVIGEGGYGIVYRGVLPDNTVIAVKNLLNNRGQAEREFRVEVEAIGRVRHKNLVKLLGYCIDGSHRMLVYEYVDNGNLDQWLHGDVGNASPLTWDIRMNIILGTAKGLAYLHDGLEPKVVHRDVKSSNILIDRQWNPKVSDFGLAKLLQSERSYVTTRVMGTFGYVAPEYASTGMLNETSDIYSFGVLIMEIISGRNPVDYARPQREVHLVEWLKVMVGDRRSEEVADPKMPERPPPKEIKRALLVALRCVDPDAQKRPKMGHVIHMLEMDDSLFRDHRRVGRESDRHEAEEESFSRHGLHTRSKWVDSSR